MIPVTSSSSRISPSPSASSSSLAPLCSSAAVERFGQRAVFSVLSNRHSGDVAVAAMFKVASEEDYQPALNETIRSIVTQYGAYEVNEQVIKLLRDDGIQLVQNPLDGSVTMTSQPVSTYFPDQRRVNEVNGALSHILPAELNSLVNSYDSQQIQLNAENRGALKRALKSNDPTIKGEIMRQAICSGIKQGFLDELLCEIRGEDDKSGRPTIKTADPRKMHRLNLSHTDLSGLWAGPSLGLGCADYSDTNLAFIDLTSSARPRNATHSKFDRSNLTHANLKNVDLRNSTLISANLINANLSGSDLTATDLSLANLTGANLTGAKLAGADLDGANMTAAKLYGADLSNATLSGANLNGVNLNGANLTNTDFSGADLSNADLSSADLSGSNLLTHAANLTGTRLPAPALFRSE